MREIGIAALLVLALAGIALVQALPAVQVVETGQQLMLRAAAIGLPLQLVYFATLAVGLGRSGGRPPGWYWRSFDHHHRLTPGWRGVVLPIFVVAALAFLVILLGIAVTTLGLVDLLVET